MSITYRSVDAKSPAFSQALSRLQRRGESDLERVEPVVKEILAAVRRKGDVAVLRYVEKLEAAPADSAFGARVRGRSRARLLAGARARRAGAVRVARSPLLPGAEEAPLGLRL